MPSVQTAAALTLANDVRSRRAVERRRVYALSYIDGRCALADLIDTLPDWLAGETLGRFLEWPRRMGPGTAHRVILHSGAGASTIVRLGDLTARQREVLSASLRGTTDNHVCKECDREMAYWNFPRNSNGWRDHAGTIRRGRCYACEAHRKRVSYEKRVLGEDHWDWIPQPPAPGELPAEPFAQWLERKLMVFKVEHDGGADEFARSLGTSPRQVSALIRRERKKVNLSTVDRILTREGSTNLGELYPELSYPDTEVAA